MADLAVVFGTRPEAIKLGPVVAELQELGTKVDVVATGQHWDLLRGTPAETDLRSAVSLGLASDGNIARWMTRALARLGTWLAEARPQLVVVQGDTMSALAGARAAIGHGIQVAHVEAGVRSHDLRDPWPEEKARVDIAELATWHYAPTSTAYVNLVTEGVQPAAIRVTGNTGVSALARYSMAKPCPAPEALIVVTMHRHEVQTTERVHSIYNDVYQLGMRWPGVRVFWSVHPAFSKLLGAEPAMPPNVTMASPMPYREFVMNVAHARLVVTDSGGLTEDATTLGVPTVIWRGTNDRPEAVEAGIAIQCGLEAGALAGAAERAIELERCPTTVFGGPDAAGEVARHLTSLL